MSIVKHRASLRRMKLVVGDVVSNPSDPQIGERKILAVRPTGYDWEYTDVPGKVFLSEDSCDPFFEWGWKLKE